MMGARGTIVLLLLVVLTGAYLMYEGPPPEQRPQPPTLLGEPRAVDPTQPVTPLLDFQPDEIVQVVLRRDDQALVTNRTADGWAGTTQASAIPDFLDNLTRLAELLRIEASPAELREYGLEPPQAEIELRRGTGDSLLLLLGDRNPAATGAYVRIGRSGHVVLAGALILWEFDKAYKALESTAKG